MKKIQQAPAGATAREAAQPGRVSMAPPQMAAQRRRAELMDNSPQTLQLKLLAQSMRSGPVAQLDGPRNYAKTFKPQKKDVMDWLKESQLIGMDLGEREDVDLANEQIGWHHQYPYSMLWDGMGHHPMADHGANLRLGPMKNRLGDPGDDVDVAYGKARRRTAEGPRDDITPTYSPYSQQLMTELLKSARSDGRKLLSDIPGSALNTAAPNKVFDDGVDMETYWSEWYLSANIRAQRVSDSNVRDMVTSYRRQALTNAIATITSKLNAFLDGMQHSYATHTPAQVEGMLGKFQNAAQVENGIPSSKLNRRGPLAEKLVEGEAPTYADLMHKLLTGDKSGKKWISRGSQGEAHSVVEQYKDKMKSGNDGLIWELVQEAELGQLKEVVEADYKKNVLRCLLKLDDERLPGHFFTGIRALQLTDRTKVLDEESVKAIIRQLAEIAPLEKTNYNDVEVAPEEAARSFVPQFGLDQKSWMIPIYQDFNTSKHKPEKMALIVDSILESNALNRWDEPSDDDDRHFMFDWQGKMVLTASDFRTALQGMLFGKKKVDDNDKFTEFVEELYELLGKRGKVSLAQVGGGEDYRQTPQVDSVEAEDKEVGQDKIYEHFKTSYDNTGLNYIRHLDAINDPTKRQAYCVGVEQALRIPGKGYSSPALKYPTPDAVKRLSEGSGWIFNAQQETELRTAWHATEFRDFLRGYLTDPILQGRLLHYLPSA